MPGPSHIRRPSRRRRAGAALALLGLAWLVGAAALRMLYGGRVLPGTSVAGAGLGGADAAEAARRLRGVPAPARGVVLVDRERRFTITSHEVGLRLDTGATVARALDAGRRGPLDLLAEPAVALGLGREVAPVYAVDPAALRRATAAIAHEVDVDPFAGGLSIDPATLAPAIRPPRAGRGVDRPALARTVAAALQEGSPQRLVLPVRERPAPSRGTLERVAAEAVAYLEAGGMRLRGAGRPLALDAADVAPLLAVEAGPGGGVTLGVDDTAVRRLVARAAARRDRRPVAARLSAPAAPVLLDGKDDVRWRPRGAAVAVRSARPGQAIDRERAAAAIAAAVREGRHDVDLPVRAVAPALDTAAARRVRSLIGTFTTHFVCCQPRVRNIELIARAVDGTVIGPGGRFSLNGVAGPRTRARGFVPAPFIADGELVQSVGGGVSQFSTTMYNAAYFAGLRLGTHQPHSFFIDRYPAGREATLDYGSIDLTWINDTRAPILIRASTTATSVTVTLYGANGGRVVRAVAGARRPVPGRDFAITVTRVVRYPDGRVVRDPHTTTYDRAPAE